MRGLVRDGRIVRLRVKISDRPGQLAAVSALIAGTGANIIEVQHQRLFGGVAAKSADLDVMLETRDRVHVGETIEVLRAAGYKVRLLEGATD
jgi:threonine dehydratase